MAAVQESVYRQIAVYLLLLCSLVIFGYPVTATWIWLIPVICVYYLIIVAAAPVGAYLVCMVRDFSKAIPLGMTFLLFTSGIFWDVRDIANEEKMNLFLMLNPIAFIIDAHRQLLMVGRSAIVCSNPAIDWWSPLINNHHMMMKSQRTYGRTRYCRVVE